jgi:hypothetical protein
MIDHAMLVALYVTAAGVVLALLVSIWALRYNARPSGNGNVQPVNPTPADAVPGMEKMNQVIRAYPLVIFSTVIVYGFVIGKVTEAVMIALGTNAFNYWYNNEQRKRQAEELREALKAPAAIAQVAIEKADQRAKAAEEKQPTVLLVPAPTPPASLAPTAMTLAPNGGGIVTVTVTSAVGTVTGDVTLSCDGAPSIIQTLVNGTTTFTLANLSPGDHAIVANYAAQGAFATSSATGTLRVAAPAPPTPTTGQEVPYV